MTKRTNKLHLPFYKNVFIHNDIMFESSVVDVNGFEHIALHRTPKTKTAKRDSGGIIVYYRNTISRGNEIYQNQNDDII